MLKLFSLTGAIAVVAVVAVVTSIGVYEANASPISSLSEVATLMDNSKQQQQQQQQQQQNAIPRNDAIAVMQTQTSSIPASSTVTTATPTANTLPSSSSGGNNNSNNDNNTNTTSNSNHTDIGTVASTIGNVAIVTGILALVLLVLRFIRQRAQQHYDQSASADYGNPDYQMVVAISQRRYFRRQQQIALMIAARRRLRDARHATTDPAQFPEVTLTQDNIQSVLSMWKAGHSEDKPASLRSKKSGLEVQDDASGKSGKSGSKVDMCLCCICLDSLHIGDSVRSLPCQHVYHTQCIDVWLGEHSTWCPHCKADVRPPEEIERAIERQQHWQQRRDEEQIQEQGQSQDGDHISVDMVQNAQMQAIALRSYQLSFGGGRLM